MRCLVNDREPAGLREAQVKGWRGMSNARRDGIVAHVERLGLVITHEEWGCFTLCLYIGVDELTTRARLDAKDELARTWGNAPHNIAQEFNKYRLTFHTND